MPTIAWETRQTNSIAMTMVLILLGSGESVSQEQTRSGPNLPLQQALNLQPAINEASDPSVPLEDPTDRDPELENFPEAINDPMWNWLVGSAWDSSLELGINGGSGNSESFNISGGFDMKNETESTVKKIGFKYINNKSNSLRVAHNARLNLDWERKFATSTVSGIRPSKWSWFVKNTYQFDEFRPFDLRIAVNSGVGYKFLDSEIQSLKGRFGAGTSKEFGGTNGQWIPEALFGLDYRRQLSKKQHLESTVDYFPSWEDYADFRVVTDLSWILLLDAETDLSLKLNINDQYDSTPTGGKANDLFYSLLLLWKF